MKRHDVSSYDLKQAESSDLITEAQQGNAEAFGELARRNRTRAYQAALRILRNSEDAEDTVQESMISAFRHIGSFRGESAFTTWLTRIVINFSLMQLRRRNRRNDVYLEDPVGDNVFLSDLLACPAPSPESTAMHKQRVSLLWSWTSELPDSLRDITIDRMQEEVSVDELAARRGITVAAAKSRLLRARLAISRKAADSVRNPVSTTA